MRALATTFVLLAAGCGGSAGQSYSVQFVPLVGGAPFSCTQSYADIGALKVTIQPQDFRMYVHGVSLARRGGEVVPLALDDDHTWQADNIALVDFEDGSGTCNTASPETHMTVTGRAPAHDDYTALLFTVGLPADHDRLDATTAPPPFNQPALYWSWSTGYKYLKVDVQTPDNGSYLFHLAAMSCSTGSADSLDCKYPDLATVTLPFSGTTAKVAVDLATLFADSNVGDSANPTDIGCMSDDGNGDCPSLFGKLGLSFENGPLSPPQTLFTVQ